MTDKVQSPDDLEAGEWYHYAHAERPEESNGELTFKLTAIHDDSYALSYADGFESDPDKSNIDGVILDGRLRHGKADY